MGEKLLPGTWDIEGGSETVSSLILFLLSALLLHSKQAAWLLTYGWDRRVESEGSILAPTALAGAGGGGVQRWLSVSTHNSPEYLQLHFLPALDPLDHGKHQMRTKESWVPRALIFQA